MRSVWCICILQNDSFATDLLIGSQRGRFFHKVTVVLKYTIIHQTDRICYHERTAKRKYSNSFTNTQARLSPTRRESRLCPHRTVCGNLSRHTGRSLAPHAILLQARLSADTRLSHLRHFHHCWWHAARCKWQRMRTCAATAWHRSRSTNPRRHRCDSPDNRSGGAVRFNISQRAGCEGARESRGSHVASLKEGPGDGCMCAESCKSLLGFLPRGVSQGAPFSVLDTLGWAPLGGVLRTFYFHLGEKEFLTFDRLTSHIDRTTSLMGEMTSLQGREVTVIGFDLAL